MTETNTHPDRLVTYDLFIFGGGTPTKHRMKKPNYPYIAIEVDDYSVHADAGINLALLGTPRFRVNTNIEDPVVILKILDHLKNKERMPERSLVTWGRPAANDLIRLRKMRLCSTRLLSITPSKGDTWIPVCLISAQS